MGNQSFFSPKNKTRTWAFLHAHLGNGPPPSSDKEGCTVLEVYCTVGCACKNSYTIQHSQAVTSFLDFESISKPNIRLTFQYLAAFSTYSAWFSVFSLSVYCFQFSVCLNAFSYSVLLGIVGPTPSTGSRLACLVLV